MDREELLKLLNASPVRILKNDDNSYTVQHASESVVSDDAACVLYRGEDGKLRLMILPLVSMSGIEPLPTSA